LIIGTVKTLPIWSLRLAQQSFAAGRHHRTVEQCLPWTNSTSTVLNQAPGIVAAKLMWENGVAPGVAIEQLGIGWSR
jgi:hypothetical protein